MINLESRLDTRMTSLETQMTSLEDRTRNVELQLQRFRLLQIKASQFTISEVPPPNRIPT